MNVFLALAHIRHICSNVGHMETSLLAPTWLRLIHRLHTLGIVESTFANSFCQFSEVATYPRHIANASELKSESIDGSTFLNFLNWHQGVVQHNISDSTLGTKFQFLSQRGELFHSLRLLESSHTDCLRCLLQLFALSEPANHDHHKSSLPQNSISPQQLALICELSLSKENRRQGFGMELSTDGGILSKQLSAEQLKLTPSNIILLCKNDTKLTLSPAAVSHLESKKLGKQIHTTLYNSNHIPQLTLKLSA